MTKNESTTLKRSNAPILVQPVDIILVRNGSFLNAPFHHFLNVISSKAEHLALFINPKIRKDFICRR